MELNIYATFEGRLTCASKNDMGNFDIFKNHRQDSGHPKNAQFDIYVTTSNFCNKFR